jgi:glycosyltransferase involved in cell wall biosynthesis
MIDIVDLCMWTKNGARYLPTVLKRIHQVIPEKVVHRKILVDDSSQDLTREIAKDFGWTVYDNPEGFVSGGTREALKHVDCEFFASFEQDLILAKDWWQKIPPHMDDLNVLTAQGIRVFTNRTLRCFNDYKYANDRKQLGGSIDNNIFRTSLLRELGGFPNNDKISVDGELRDIMRMTKYKWVIDETAVSYHIRESVFQTARHEYRQYIPTTRDRFVGVTRRKLLKGAATAPLRLTRIALKEQCPQIYLAYPYLSLMNLKSFMHRQKVIK